MTFSPGGSVDDTYIGQSAQWPAPAATGFREDDAQVRIRQIPKDCLRELIGLGALDRVLVAYGRSIGRLAIDSFQPFRSLYFYGIVICHLGKQRTVALDNVVRVCEAAAVLNNATVPEGMPSMLSFLDRSFGAGSHLAIPVSDTKSLAHRAWQELDRKRMGYAMAAGRLVADLDAPPVRRCLEQHIRERCIIRPVFDYMYHEFIDTQHTDLSLRDESLQFQIYSTVREVMERVHGDSLPLSYVMYTTLFAIAETNDRIAHAVAEGLPDGAPLDLYSTVMAAGCDDDATVSNIALDPGSTEPLAARELLCLLDWDFAAALGYMLAHRYHDTDPSIAEMRARLGAMAFGVDIQKEQPFPPVLPLQDGDFHSFVASHIHRVYAKWPYGFVYMVIDEAVVAYNDIIHGIRGAR